DAFVDQAHIRNVNEHASSEIHTDTGVVITASGSRQIRLVSAGVDGRGVHDNPICDGADL
ncbi:MAG: hypothetical protein JRN68_07695, partial [Nitrososphaerota archaeon]|nr:hypothetical protein [Nitrososphaerota archaeon]